MTHRRKLVSGHRRIGKDIAAVPQPIIEQLEKVRFRFHPESLLSQSDHQVVDIRCVLAEEAHRPLDPQVAGPAGRLVEGLQFSLPHRPLPARLRRRQAAELADRGQQLYRPRLRRVLLHLLAPARDIPLPRIEARLVKLRDPRRLVRHIIRHVHLVELEGRGTDRFVIVHRLAHDSEMLAE